MPCPPPATDGVVGKLTREQEQGLKDFWKEFLGLIDKAPKQGSGPKSKGSANSAPKDEKDAGKDIPKDDNAKERMKAEEERRNAEAAFEEYSDVEKIFEKGEEGMKDAEGFLMQLTSGKTYTHGTDFYGRPVQYIHVAKHRTYDQSPKALEDFVLFQMESVRALLADDNDKVDIVFDMTGFGIRNMGDFIVKCLEAYYPESLNVMIVHNAPWVFQGIWKILAPMLDPVVRNKIQMTKNTDDLCEFIPKKHLVKQLGGTSDWTWKYPEIVPGENAKQKDDEERKRLQQERNDLIADYIEVTREWMKSDEAAPEIVKKRKMIVHKMQAQYWELDPYIRGRGCYHRLGNIVGNGLVSFEYPIDGGEGEWEVIGYKTCREQHLLQAEALARELGIEGDSKPSKKSSGTGEAKPKKKKKSNRA
ncbi:hypothetical protein OIV83_001010 [Microbotryomycetes sp. JL201]|nr:hypothetical protein OIV83_001010 [Microbotryomycetes sp. JL201]